MPWLVTDRNIVLVLEGRGGEETDWRNAEIKCCHKCEARSAAAAYLCVHVCLCVKVGCLRSLTGCRLGSGLARELQKNDNNR